ncbi:serine/threonine-protein kinase [Spirulina sp. CS-785/01]|uniref:serine/threonine protein kinase n=1 Tax=Spirulina sp. CS-785/01 TaxID=3021716 RepID=UPI00232AEDCB|nr:serine/threonine-protein kinase [Spirulina sp. CS-785/01]MDB9315460.1 serine/threonine-protein kinase [Spirulina sp. CS-785/01]
MIQNFPDLTDQGYTILRVLSQHPTSGRKTYLAQQLNTENWVVLKQFQFNHVYTNWSAYEAVSREMEVLRSLSHPRIPRYLHHFDTPEALYLVQEYKAAQNLADCRNLTPSQLRRIALQLLDVLQYLQQQTPPIFHRDIKPANILIETNNGLQAYLVDFGFAHPYTGSVSESSIIKGTLGFMPPEQLLNRQLTPASDLYSLGVTLISLLTKTPSHHINNLIGEDYQIHFKEQLTHRLHPKFSRWLEKLVTPQQKHRFPDAKTALNHLHPTPATRPLRQPLLWPTVGVASLMLGIGGYGGYKLSDTLHTPPSSLQATLQLHSLTPFLEKYLPPQTVSSPDSDTIIPFRVSTQGNATFPLTAELWGEYHIKSDQIIVKITQGLIRNNTNTTQHLYSFYIQLENPSNPTSPTKTVSDIKSFFDLLYPLKVYPLSNVEFSLPKPLGMNTREVAVQFTLASQATTASHREFTYLQDSLHPTIWSSPFTHEQ